MTLDQIRDRIREWAATHTEVRVDLDEDDVKLVDDTIQVSINDPDDEFAWVGFYLTDTLSVFAVDASDDMDDDDRTNLTLLADDLIATLKA